MDTIASVLLSIMFVGSIFVIYYFSKKINELYGKTRDLVELCAYIDCRSKDVARQTYLLKNTLEQTAKENVALHDTIADLEALIETKRHDIHNLEHKNDILRKQLKITNDAIAEYRSDLEKLRDKSQNYR